MTDDRDEKAAFVEECSIEGWSAAVYSHKRMRMMSDRGSLFVQHLKQEGQILHDDKAWLRSLFDDFSPKPSYDQDLMEWRHAIKPLDRKAKEEIHAALLGDILCVFLRNAGIFMMANDGVYRFSFSEIVQYLSRRFCLSRTRREFLLDLRIIKASYRARCRVDDALETIAEVLSVVNGCLGTEANMQLPFREHPRSLPNKYASLRDLVHRHRQKSHQHAAGPEAWRCIPLNLLLASVH